MGIEWPMCLPGVGVRLSGGGRGGGGGGGGGGRRGGGGGGGGDVMCELQVDWMHAQVCTSQPPHYKTMLYSGTSDNGHSEKWTTSL